MLTQPTEKGGISFPDLMIYFYATQEDILMKWTNNEVKPNFSFNLNLFILCQIITEVI